MACNIAALKPAEVSVFGVIGTDWRGSCLKKLLVDENMNTGGLLELPDRFTNAYCKPLRKGSSEVVYEDPRIDFEDSEQVSESTQTELFEKLKTSRADVICVCDQLTGGCVGKVLREGLCDLGKQGRIVIVDSRDRIGLYRNVIVKPNEMEAVEVCGHNENYETMVRYLSKRNGRPALITLGDKGCIVCENGQTDNIAGHEVSSPIDICGAGDTFMSALACAVAAGCSIKEAAFFANAASAVTIKKLFMTGTASREEITEIWV